MAIKPYIDDEPEQGLPVAPTREELYRRLKEKYMKQRSEAEKTLEQPYETPTDLAESKRLSALTSGLSKAAAQMGSIRGKAPTTNIPETLSEFDKAQELAVMADMQAREQAKKDLDITGRSLLQLDREQEADKLQQVKQAAELSEQERIQAERDAKNDPNSEISELLRQLVKRAGMKNISDNTTAANIEKLLPSITSIAKAEQAAALGNARLDFQKEKEANIGGRFAERLELSKGMFAHKKQEDKLKAQREVEETARKLKERVFDKVTDLRKEYLNQSTTKETAKIKASYERLKAVKPTAAGDLALIFSFMKMLDPGSVVREGEFANAQNAAGVDDRVKNLYNNLMRGERLNEQQRKQFITEANNLYLGQLVSQRGIDNQYRAVAKKNNLPLDELNLLTTAEQASEDTEAEKEEQRASEKPERSDKKASVGKKRIVTFD